MELNPSLEAVSSGTADKLTSVLWNPLIYYHVNKSPPLVPVLYQNNAADTTPSSLTKNHSDIVLPPTYLLPSGLFLSGLPTCNIYAILFSPMVQGIHAWIGIC